MSSMPVPAPRYHALDSLRAVMMLLGIYLHAAVAYSFDGGWPYKDPNSQTTFFHASLGIIHAFRMPVFFVMAGFFSGLLYLRRSPGGFAHNRALRVLVPFVAGWLLLFPTVAALSYYGRVFRHPEALNAVWTFMAGGKFWASAHPMHLWFLEYLVLFYALFLAFGYALRHWVPERIRTSLNAAFRWVMLRPWRPLVFAVPTFIALCFMNGGGLDDPPGFMPLVRLVLAYGTFFAFGWLMFLNVDLLPTFQRHAWFLIAFCILVIPFALWYEQGWNRSHNLTFYVRAGYHAVFLWSLIFALTGLFLRYLDRPMAKMRYVSDSSYFLYLVHMPVLIVIQLVLARYAWSPVLKVFLLLGAAIPVMLILYHFCVRPTFIGEMLNGRKYPRQAAPAPVPQTATLQA